MLTAENQTAQRKTCLSVTLSTTNPTWTDLSTNPGLCGEKPATNHLSYGTANQLIYIKLSTESCQVNLILVHISQA
jgi:hypothetical protein